MNSALELLKLIKKRPAMYLGANSISLLKAYLDGWEFRSPDNIKDVDLLTEFQDWIEIKYKIKTAHSWSRILLFYSQDECDALKLFFNRFGEFLEMKNHPDSELFK